MSRTLILSYFYAPMISARAFRWSALAERWAGQGHQVDVIAGLESNLSPQERLNGVNVYRVNSPLHQIMSRSAGPSGAAAAQTKTSRLSLRRRLVTTAYFLWTHLYWPDAGFLWYRPALRQALQLIAAHDYDALISVSPFFTAHLAAARLGHRGILCWLADFGDPFSLQDIQPHNNTRLYGSLNRWVERRVLGGPDVITVTTEPTARLYSTHFPEIAHKIRVIPPLLSMSPAPQRHGSQSMEYSRIKLLFAGAFYPQTRPPDFLLKLFAGLLHDPALAGRLELHLYGDTGTVRASFGPYVDLIERGKIVLHGMVPREEVSAAMDEAAVLVNLGNKTAYQLPSKVVEYASTGKPVLNLIQVEDDSSKAVYQSYPAALTLLDQGGALDDQVGALRQWLTDLPPRVDAAFLREWLAAYQLDAIAQAYDDIMERRG